MTEEEELEVAQYIDTVRANAWRKIDDQQGVIILLSCVIAIFILIIWGLVAARQDTRAGVVEVQTMHQKALVLEAKTLQDKMATSTLAKDDASRLAIEERLDMAAVVINEPFKDLLAEVASTQPKATVMEEWQFYMQEVFGMDMVANQARLDNAQAQLRSIETSIDALDPKLFATPDPIDQDKGEAP